MNPKEQDTANFPNNSLNTEQAPRELTQRQSWVYKQIGFLKFHIRMIGANRSLGFETSTIKQNDNSRGSNTDMESVESRVHVSQTTLPLQSSTPVSTETRILEHFEQMQTLMSSFLQQKSTSDRQPFYDYVASEADKMSPEEYENFKVKGLQCQLPNLSAQIIDQQQQQKQLFIMSAPPPQQQLP